MRIAFIGGTREVGPETVPRLVAAGHEVVVAHSGTHENPAVADVEHLHGSRDDLLDAEGSVVRWKPDVLIDTFPGGANGDKARMLLRCSRHAGARHIIVVSSMDVYQYGIDAGLGDGSGTLDMPGQSLPLTEDAPIRETPYPGAKANHNNAAMEAALHDAGQVTVLRPGTIYGVGVWPQREWTLVERIHRGQRMLPLPDGGVQLFHRVALERVARAIVAALDRAPDGFWACNIADPTYWTYAGLAAQVGGLLDWEWEPARVPFNEAQHPWGLAHPFIASDRRLRETLLVTEPDPRDALRDAVEWMWASRHDLAPAG